TETEFYYDFHGYTIDGKTEMMAQPTSRRPGTSANGALTAAFGGIHGWFFQNQSLNKVVVRLKISGFTTQSSRANPTMNSTSSPMCPWNRLSKRSEIRRVGHKGV